MFLFGPAPSQKTHMQNPGLTPRRSIEELLGQFHYRASWLQEELQLGSRWPIIVPTTSLDFMSSAPATLVRSSFCATPGYRSQRLNGGFHRTTPIFWP